VFNRGEKMSKSVGNVIDPFALADAYGVDPLRVLPARGAVRTGRQLQPRGSTSSPRINDRCANDLKQPGAALR
jgi:methionyl-tRNA synthetase